jgi:hypothetical protein
MKTMADLVKIVIPIYKNSLDRYEYRSLDQCVKILSGYPATFVKPRSLDISFLRDRYRGIEDVSFDDSYFKGISGYNRLMLSADFYKAFLDFEYILVYQLDAYVFRDELKLWCGKGYDYTGAPWLKRPLYNLPLISSYMKWKRERDGRKNRRNKQMLFNKVGNGGLSLRRVASHYNSALKYAGEIDFYLAQPRSHFYNEDVFWATVPGFSYPDAGEALYFAFDKYPAYCYRLTGGKLPFGCHSWYKRKMKRFWKKALISGLAL